MAEFDAASEREKREQAEYFLRDEMVDSGIIVERAQRLEFWHLSFQEYLAAFEIAGKGDTEQTRLLFENERLFQSEWHEVLLLLGGILYKQGAEKINLLIDALIANCPAKPDNQTLPERAKTVALLGGIVQDLSPFDFQPANSDYRELVQSVMCIFEPTTFRKIPVSVRIAAADALGRVGDPRLVNDPMIEIPGGSFLMGAQKKDKKQPNYDEQAYSDEAPVHEVKLSSFFISKYPVTVGQFRRFVDAEGYRQERYWQNGGFKQFTAPDKWDEQLNHPTRPVVYVSWYEAFAYCHWFREFKGDARLYRLPTEAEWERAARGPAAAYRKYHWGNKEPDGETANFGESKLGHASPVGIFPESCSPEGVIDLAGNVWEWCWDWKDVYDKPSIFYEKSAGGTNPVNDESGEWGKVGTLLSRVLRGGSWNYSAQICRSANRGRRSPGRRYGYLGFRLVFVP